MKHGFGADAGVRAPLYISIDAIAVRPVAFHSDDGEPLFGDQQFRELGSPSVELRRSVRCLAEENESRVTNTVEQRVEIARFGKRTGQGFESIECRLHDAGWMQDLGQRWSAARATLLPSSPSACILPGCSRPSDPACPAVGARCRTWSAPSLSASFGGRSREPLPITHA